MRSSKSSRPEDERARVDGEPATGATSFEVEFACPLPNGLHARPASLLSEIAGEFDAEITLTNERNSSSANAKSVLELVANDVKLGDTCFLRIAGADSPRARKALREFVDNVLPGCDEALPAAASNVDRVLPRVLRDGSVRWHAGTVVCPGVGRGVLVAARGLSLPTELLEAPALDHAEESARVKRGLDRVLESLHEALAARPSEVEAGILRAHQSIATDVGLHERISEALGAGRSAARAIVEAAEYFADRLRGSGSAYVRERVVDVEDIAMQLLEAIYGERVLSNEIVLDRPSIVAAENLTPRQLLALDKRWLKGLVLEHAGATSHAVILARSFDIPTLTGVADLRAKLELGAEVVVDANLGLVIPDLPPHVRRFYERAERTLQRRRDRFACFAHSQAVTRDGARLEIAANVATAEELAPAFALGADGIGLFRTEMLFMDRDSAPSEAEQLAIYVQAARAAAASRSGGGGAVLIRTFDVGGDKPVPYFHLPEEANPFLGNRGARLYRDHREVFVAQLRAIVRASAFGEIWIMLPMISAVHEVRWVKSELARIRAELTAAGIAHDPTQRLGVMIEVPSAAFLIDQLAAEVDFFSIGTNDLAQYFFAADRDNRHVAPLSSTRAPSFLRFLSKIVRDARARGRWVGMCGEMARSPRNLPLLVGLGLDEISTAAPEIPAVKMAVSTMSAVECRALLEHAMQCETVEEVEAAVAAFCARGASSALLMPDFVHVGSDSVSKEEAIREIVDSFFVAGRVEEPHAIEDAVWAREAVYSTGLGHGFAIPHCKTDAIASNSIGVVRLVEPVDWGALDGQPVRCVILLAMRASDNEGAHMRVFSKLARKLMHEEFRERLLAAPDREHVLACLAEELGLTVDAG